VRSELEQALNTAGELSALLGGQRGLVLIQLFNGWDPAKGQPLYSPLAIHMLEQALAAPGIGHCCSVAPGGVGLTAILFANHEPFASYAAHLASFGCQANAVAGSAYYKVCGCVCALCRLVAVVLPTLHACPPDGRPVLRHHQRPTPAADWAAAGLQAGQCAGLRGGIGGARERSAAAAGVSPRGVWRARSTAAACDDCTHAATPRHTPQVAEDIAKLSKVELRLPWSVDDPKNVRPALPAKKKKAAGGGKGSGGGFGGGGGGKPKGKK
jgi:hypothetical protein